jgi:hypothetical protein
MNKLVLAAALVAATTVGVAAQDFGGTYNVQGTNLNGSPYSGTAEVKVISDTTCEIYWTTGGTTSQGICMRYGPAFAAGYVMGDGTVGLVIYQIMDDGTLDGTWTISGAPGSGTEVLTKR